ncbi:hypothetical protein AAG584_21195 [Vreelandella titanicae]|uniref:hypothetical protein n=1 Tax=Vreelandella titanicae TaxID=664683 RepID=UPI003159AC22
MLTQLKAGMRAGSATDSTEALLNVGWGIEVLETLQGITDYPTAGQDGYLGIEVLFSAGEALHTAQLNARRMAVVHGLHRSDER